jgi:hypothetical protein
MFAKLFGRKQASNHETDGQAPADEAAVNNDSGENADAESKPENDAETNAENGDEVNGGAHHNLAMAGDFDETGEFETEQVRKGIFRKFESKVRRKVDGYVDAKAVELLDDATRRAEQFRQETLFAVRENAMQLLDVTEHRIDEKLVHIEKMLEDRLQAEMRMRLRALILTLLFVLMMALISIGYVWFKRETGLEAPLTDETQSTAPAESAAPPEQE